MKVSKSAALVIALTVIFAMFVLLYIKAAVITDIPAGSFIAGIVSLAGGYIGLGVLNNGVKGKCWNSEMYNCEKGGDTITPRKNKLEETHGSTN
jgi:hypothetical protein